jgi:DNA helicase HerA-like ATPase
LDVPDKVLGQLSNRVQHALRAFTPRDQKAVNAAAETFRQNPKLDVAEVITQLGVGEALVSFLDEKGTPGIVQRAFVLPPQSRVGPITPDERQKIIHESVIYGHYEKAVDRESAYERLTSRADQKAPSAPAPAYQQPGYQQPSYQQSPNQQSQPQQQGGGFHIGWDTLGSVLGGGAGMATTGRGRQREGLGEAMAKSAVRAVGSQLGRQIMRGLMGSIMGGSRR